MTIRSVVLGDSVDNRPRIYSVGEGAKFNVTTNGSGAISAITLNFGGINYSVGDTLLINKPGSPSVKLVITVTSVSEEGTITVFTTPTLPSGTGYTASQTNILINDTTVTSKERVRYSSGIKNSAWTSYTDKKINFAIAANDGLSSTRTYMAFGNDGKVATSTDFSTWTNRTSVLTSTGWGTSDVISSTRSWIYNPSRVVIGGTGSKLAQSSDYGSTWSYINALANNIDWGSTTNISSISMYSSSDYFFTGSKGQIAFSNNLSNFTYYNSLINNSDFNTGINGFAKSTAVNIVIGRLGKYAVSTDLINWTTYDLNTADDLNRIQVFYNEFFISTSGGNLIRLDTTGLNPRYIDTKFIGFNIRAVTIDLANPSMHVINRSNNYLSSCENFMGKVSSNTLNKDSFTVETMFPDNGWPNTTPISNVTSNTINTSSEYEGILLVTSDSGDIAEFLIEKFSVGGGGGDSGGEGSGY